MDYQKHYQLLVTKARTRPVPAGYTEKHHVIPRCMGGLDAAENIAQLYPEEHFFAHVLLLKIYKNTEHRYALAKAVPVMARGATTRWKGKRRRVLYGWLRREHAKAMSASQTGIGNSQARSRWICHLELKLNKKLPITAEIPNGWVLGRNIWKRLCPQCQVSIIDPLRSQCCRQCKDKNDWELSRQQSILILEEYLQSSFASLKDFAQVQYNTTGEALSIRFGKHFDFYRTRKGRATKTKTELRDLLHNYKSDQNKGWIQQQKLY